ncbi:MAG: exodeoxyribonuclease VII large subunit [Bacteroidales bacterium]|nr:exodeoxyribonuclease VII large subunit [Bacteroidales bacterium]
MERQINDLYTLLTALKKGVETVFPAKMWVKAEISQIQCRAGGHCYMELSQTGTKGVIAQVKGIIWASKYQYLNSYFRQITGMPLQAGIEVLLYVQVNYSQVYGLSLVADDIDPAFTLGEQERIRRETIERLRREGLTDLQKALPTPQLPRSFAVISSADAAGFGDFMKHTGDNPYGFKFDIRLFPALMQGAGCPDSIISALEDIALSDKHFDMVLILRGGGSDLDLACFDDYSLCAGIARFPLPVYTAIGHDRDFHVADMVAHEYAKTPTALADMIVEWYADEDARLLDYATRLKLAFTAKISAMDSRVTRLEGKIRLALSSKISILESRISNLETRIHSAVRSKFAALETRIDNIEKRIKSGFKAKIATMAGRVTIATTRIRSGLTARVSTMASRVSVLEAKISSSDPRKILERGYVLAVDAAGVALRGVAGHERGEKVSLVFPDGAMKCTVDDIILRNVSAEGEN